MRDVFRLTMAVTLCGWLWGAAAPAEGQAQAHDSNQASAELKDARGQTVGRATLMDTPNGVLVSVNLDKAAAGERAFHIHEVGQCQPPSFESAGGHFNPTSAEHGFHDAKGPHAGDLPNIHVAQGGQLTFEFLADNVTLKSGQQSLLDSNGSALVMHAKPDDYRTNPSGAAGDRVACGVISR